MTEVNALEVVFDDFFSTIKFEKVSNKVGDSPNFQNADYINEDKKVIVELKIIDKDYFKEGGVIDRLCTIIPVREDKNSKLPPNSPGLYRLTIPKENREGKHDNFEEPLRRVLKKASRQIKETNGLFFNGKGNGIVIIALNMKTLIDIEAVYALIADLLMYEFSSIAGFLVCVPTLAFNGGELSCIHGVKVTAPEFIQKICAELGDYFCEFFYNFKRYNDRND